MSRKLPSPCHSPLTPQHSPTRRPAAATSPALRPLGALLLAGSVSAWAQAPASPNAAPDKDGATLSTVTVKDSADGSASATSLRAAHTQIGKGTQALRDLPQSVTVMTERLIDDRNLDDFRELLRTTAGVSFQAGETGEEDVRLRGFSLGQAGDIYVDGMRDGVLYERDTFNNDRVEILKGSASMLFGKGSTGGVVNQVNKRPFLMDQNELNYTLGTGGEHRLSGDFNRRTGEGAALRISALQHQADNFGATSRKNGLAAAYRWGMGTRDEFEVGLYHLAVHGRPNYNHPWFTRDGVIEPTLPASNFYGLASDYQDSSADHVTFSHTHRFDHDTELLTRVRHGRYERDLWSSVIRFGQTGGQATTAANLGPDTVLTRSPKGRVGSSRITQLQSDLSHKFEALGHRHELLAGVDLYDEDARRNNNVAGSPSGLNTTVGQPNNGDWRADTRGRPVFNTFESRNLGLYLQNTAAVSDTVKLIAGLRFDRFDAAYQTAETTAANGTVTPARQFSRSESLWSPRLGALYQPSELASYYIAWGTSFNTSGDTYQFSPGGPNAALSHTGPEKSRNLEIGGKFELFEQRASLGVALFHADKYNERNADPDTAAQQYLLSGRRHASGMEFNLAGRIHPRWEVFYNHTWIPSARIDQSNVALSANGTGAQVQGDRPALTPRHSASLWTTYRLTQKLRLGAGLNYRGRQSPEGARHLVAQRFATLDAMAEYQLTETVLAKLNISNLTDKLYADALYRGFYTPGAPRSVQLSFKTLF